MANKPDERLIILLPPELLEQVRRAAEAEDLSVSQIVRRALRNELKSLTLKSSPDSATFEDLIKLLKAWNDDVRAKDLVPTSSKRAPEKISTTETATIVGRKPRFRI